MFKKCLMKITYDIKQLSSSVLQSGLSLKQKSGAAHRLRHNEASVAEGSYFPLLFAV